MKIIHNNSINTPRHPDYDIYLAQLKAALDSQTDVTVIDSMMGTGKTTWAIREILQGMMTGELYVVVVPTIDEQLRYRDAIHAAGGEISIPVLDEHDTLRSSFNELISRGQSVVTTHRLLECWNNESINLIREWDYTLILDEVIDVISSAGLGKKGVRSLIAEGIVISEPDPIIPNMERLYATDVELDKNEGMQKEFKAIKRKPVYHVSTDEQDSFFVSLVDPRKFTAFNKVYLLTYLFEGQILKYWLDIYGVTYDKKSVDDGVVINHQPATGKHLSPLIDIIQAGNITKAYKGYYDLSCSWFDNASKTKLNNLKNDLYSYFRHVCKTPAELNLVTCRKAHAESILRGPFKFINGCTVVKLRDAEGTPDKAKIEAAGYCFASWNLRGTNLYAHKASVAYPVNVFPNPIIEKFFIANLEDFDKTAFRDTFALSAMIQFMFRSRIRLRKPLPIKMYVPSARMRKLLLNWLDS